MLRQQMSQSSNCSQAGTPASSVHEVSAFTISEVALQEAQQCAEQLAQELAQEIGRSEQVRGLHTSEGSPCLLA